jgi:hypothetical protein
MPAMTKTTKRTAAFAAALLAASATLAGAKECTVAYTEGQDDSPAILSAFSECRENSVIIFEAGRNYSAYTPVTLDNLSGLSFSLITMNKDVGLIMWVQRT